MSESAVSISAANVRKLPLAEEIFYPELKQESVISLFLLSLFIYFPYLYKLGRIAILTILSHLVVFHMLHLKIFQFHIFSNLYFSILCIFFFVNINYVLKL